MHGQVFFFFFFSFFFFFFFFFLTSIERCRRVYLSLIETLQKVDKLLTLDHIRLSELKELIYLTVRNIIILKILTI